MLSDILLTSQGGFIPDIVLWLSYFYTSRELPVRLRYAYHPLKMYPLLSAI